MVFKLCAWSLACTFAACTFDPSGSGLPPASTGGAGGMSGAGATGGTGGIAGGGGAGGNGTTGSGGTGGASGNACAALTLGARVCVDSTHSGTCQMQVSMLVPVTDRACPPDSFCASGYCQPPAAPRMCMRARDCMESDVCNLFVRAGGQLGQLAGFCSPPFPGTNPPQARCTEGSQCGTGFCADFGNAMPACLSLCGADGDCADGARCEAFNLPATVEGASTGALKACSPGN